MARVRGYSPYATFKDPSIVENLKNFFVPVRLRHGVAVDLFTRFTVVKLPAFLVLNILVKSPSELIGNVAFHDDFTQGLGKWRQVKDAAGAKIEIAPNDGRPFPGLLLDTFDFQAGKLFVVSSDSFILDKRALHFGADLKQGNSTFPDQKQAMIALVKPDTMVRVAALSYLLNK